MACHTVMAFPPEKIEPIASAMMQDVRALFLFCCITGLRLHEARNLQVGHIWNEETQSYHLDCILRVTKGGRKRHLYLNEERIAILEDRRKTYGGSWGDPEWSVFRPDRRRRYVSRVVRQSRTSRPTPPKGLGDALCKLELKRAIAAAGLPKGVYATHSCRKFFADTLNRAGVPVQHIKDHLGHANILMTMRYVKEIDADSALRDLDLAKAAREQAVARARLARMGRALPPPPPAPDKAMLPILAIAAPVKSAPKPATVDPGVELY